MLRLYHLYRLTIGLVLVLLISSDLDDQLLDLAQGSLFRYGSWLYLIVNIVIAVLLQRPRHLLQVFSLAMFDVTMLSALFYAAGGTPSGIGNLMIVAVAIANILLRGRIGLLIAAVASIGMIYLTFYLSLSRPAAASQFVQAGALGALCFAAALFVQTLSKRLRHSETLAEQRASDVASLETLNALILQRMRTGILVLDEQRRVLLAEAFREAEELRGDGDAQAAAIYAAAYGQDQEFYAFHRSLQAYRESFSSKEDVLVLDPKSDFFRYLEKSN